LGQQSIGTPTGTMDNQADDSSNSWWWRRPLEKSAKMCQLHGQNVIYFRKKSDFSVTYYIFIYWFSFNLSVFLSRLTTISWERESLYTTLTIDLPYDTDNRSPSLCFNFSNTWNSLIRLFSSKLPCLCCLLTVDIFVIIIE
jgi:hypothetical protein